MDTVNSAMKNLIITEDLKRLISEFIITTHNTQELQRELGDFIKKRISQTYRVQCSIYIFDDAVKSNIIFSQLFKGNDYLAHDKELIEQIVKRMETVLEPPEAKLCVQDHKNKKINDDKIYFLAKGKCEVKVNDRFSDRIEEQTVGFIRKGQHFGEISMVFQCKRSATV